MTTHRHGFTIGIERTQSDFFISLKAIGKLTHEDYQTITPLIDDALRGVADAKMNIFVDASEFEGWELRAAWDDFKFGVKHHNEFNKIAIFGNQKWQEFTGNIANWFVAGEVRFFKNPNTALIWLESTD
jgi:hypothetical protein